MSGGDPDEERAEGPSARPDADAAWRSIVDNYGERALLDDPGPDPEPETPPEPVVLGGPVVRGYDEVGGVDRGEVEPEDRYVPPPPPPAPRPRGVRGVAWCGVLLAPLLLLLVAVTDVGPGWSSFVLVVWFLGGFGYLVATMSREPRDPFDDGAQI